MQLHAPFPDISRCEIKLIWANAREIEPVHADSPTRVSSEDVVWLIESGGVCLQHGLGQTTARPGEWLLLPVHARHQQFTPGSRLLSIRFQLNLPGGTPVFARGHAHCVPADSVPEFTRAARLLQQTLLPWQQMQTLALGRARIPLLENLRIEALFYAWLGEYVRLMQRLGEPGNLSQPLDPRLAAALEALRSHPMRERFSEAALAAPLQLSSRQLNRLLQAHAGQTLKGLYEARRLELARHMLRETRLPLKEIAFELGFSSPAHFSNWFRGRLQTTPTAFRNQSAPETPMPMRVMPKS